jgi:hypothetical protein
MNKNIIIGIFLLVATLMRVRCSLAAETMFFDSTNNYLGACQLTNRSEWDLKDETTVSKFEIWYYWNQGETSIPVKLFLNGEKFAEFEAVRSSCDPYQKSWCNADFQINKVFPAGKYSTEIPNSRQCLKPGGTGAIRLYKDDGQAVKIEPSPTVMEKKVAVATPTPVVITQSPICSCNQTTIIASAAITSVITSGIVFLLLKKL